MNVFFLDLVTLDLLWLKDLSIGIFSSENVTRLQDSVPIPVRSNFHLLSESTRFFSEVLEVSVGGGDVSISVFNVSTTSVLGVLGFESSRTSGRSSTTSGLESGGVVSESVRTSSAG